MVEGPLGDLGHSVAKRPGRMWPDLGGTWVEMVERLPGDLSYGITGENVT